ncbi:hypothetical protein AAG570_000849 [Ranatra chinensis]|uniref:Integrase zinc-binding domain-containing protein n=1 Tax=Ranatra chinensis TaxID=642074 RepID=A0ABD0YY90_9HEMI
MLPRMPCSGILPRSSDDPWRLAIPKPLRLAVLRQCHDSPTAAHLGVFKTRGRVRERYYCPGMHTDIAQYVARCRTCLSIKPETGGPKGLMGSEKEVSEPWDVIATGIMGPFPPSSKQNWYLVVVSDYFTKYSLLFPDCFTMVYGHNRRHYNLRRRPMELAEAPRPIAIEVHDNVVTLCLHHPGQHAEGGIGVLDSLQSPLKTRGPTAEQRHLLRRETFLGRSSGIKSHPPNTRKRPVKVHAPGTPPEEKCIDLPGTPSGPIKEPSITPSTVLRDKTGNHSDAASATATRKPPPIHIAEVSDFIRLCIAIAALVEPDGFECKSRLRERSRTKGATLCNVRAANSTVTTRATVIGQPQERAATCALCGGDHPANYKGCNVYKDLQKITNPVGNRRDIPPPTREPISTHPPAPPAISCPPPRAEISVPPAGSRPTAQGTYYFCECHCAHCQPPPQ